MQLHLPHGLVDLDRREVRLPGKPCIGLTELETQLLAYLARDIGQPVAREALLSDVWNYAPTSRSRCVDTTVRRLRHKIELDLASPKHLMSVHGIGYKLVLSPPLAVRAHETSLPALPDVTGWESVIQHVLVRLSQADAVALLGPPGGGRRAVAIAVAHSFDGPVSLGPEDPGEGLWVRLDGSTGPARAKQLVLPPHPQRGGGAEVVVPVRADDGLPKVAPTEPWPTSLLSLAACGDAIGGAQARALGVSEADVDDLLARGWLQTGPGGVRVASCWEVAPTPAAERRHTEWCVAWLEELSGGAPIPASQFEAIQPHRMAVFSVLERTCEADAALALRLLYLLNRYLIATVPVPRTLHWVQAALTNAGDEMAPIWQFRAEIQLAGLLRLAARCVEAHAALDRAARLAPVADRGFVTAVRATVLHTERRHAEALDAYLRAADELQKEHPGRAATFRAEASIQVLRRGDVDEAVQVARQAVREARSTGDARLLARCEGRLGLVLARVGWTWEALPRLQSSVDAFRALGDDHQLAFALLHLAEARMDAGELDLAATTLQEGQPMAVLSGVQALCASYSRARGVLAVLQDDAATAREVLERSLCGHEDTERGSCAVEALGWLAVAYADLGLTELAMRTLGRMADAPTEAGFRCLVTGRGHWQAPEDSTEIDERLLAALVARRNVA